VVEGSAPEAGNRAAGGALRAIEHFPGRAVGEGQQEYSRGIDSLFHEIGHAVDERPCFPGAGGGQDEHRAVRGSDGRVLFVVERFSENALCGRGGSRHVGAWL